MNITEIHEGSEAFRALQKAFADPNTYRVNVEVRPEGMAVKVNGGMWSPTLCLTKWNPAPFSE